MIQPNDETMSKIRRNSILSSIVTAVSNKPLSIAEIARKFSLNRSTTRYYLGLLKEQRMIIFDRQEHTPGRPTLIKIDENSAKEYWMEAKKRAEEYRAEMNKDPITKEVLSFISKNRAVSEEKILNHIKSLDIDNMYISKVFNSLQYLKTHNKIIDEWKLK